jgi:hypothetical protein
VKLLGSGRRWQHAAVRRMVRRSARLPDDSQLAEPRSLRGRFRRQERDRYPVFHCSPSAQSGTQRFSQYKPCPVAAVVVQLFHVRSTTAMVPSAQASEIAFGRRSNFATYSPGDPDRHADASDKDVLSVIHRSAVTQVRRHDPDTGHLGRCQAPGMPGITRYRSRWPQEDKRYRVLGS